MVGLKAWDGVKRGAVGACLAKVLNRSSILCSTDLATTTRWSDTQEMCSLGTLLAWCQGHHLSSHISGGESTAEAPNYLPSVLQVRHGCGR